MLLTDEFFRFSLLGAFLEKSSLYLSSVGGGKGILQQSALSFFTKSPSKQKESIRKFQRLSILDDSVFSRESMAAVIYQTF